MTANKQELEFVHNDLYGVALKMSAKFVGKRDIRPLLHYAYHRADGDIIATDSHRLIHIKNMHGYKEDFLINPKNFSFAKGNYMETDKISNKDEHTKSITLNKEHIKLWMQIFKSINQTMKVMKMHIKNVRINFKDDHVEVELKSQEMIMKLPIKEYAKIDKLDRIAFNAEYLKDALEAHYKLESEEVTFYFNGELRPIILDDNKQVKTLILPVRTY